jgi:hypothetical protein
MRTPQFILTCRLATVAVTVVVILLVVLALVGVGPLDGVLGPATLSSGA